MYSVQKIAEMSQADYDLLIARINKAKKIRLTARKQKLAPGMKAWFNHSKTGKRFDVIIEKINKKNAVVRTIAEGSRWTVTITMLRTREDVLEMI